MAELGFSYKSNRECANNIRVELIYRHVIKVTFNRSVGDSLLALMPPIFITNITSA